MMDGSPLRTFDIPLTALCLHRCCAREATGKYDLTLVQIGRQGDTGFAVATDSKIIAFMEWPVEGPADDFEMFLPRRVLDELSAVVPPPGVMSDEKRRQSTVQVRSFEGGWHRVGLMLWNELFTRSITFREWQYGKYPPWRGLFNDAEEVPLRSGVEFNPNLISELTGVIAELLDDCHEPAKIRLSVRAKPAEGAISMFAAGQGYCGRVVRGLAMPLNEDEKKSKKPAEGA